MTKYTQNKVSKNVKTLTVKNRSTEKNGLAFSSEGSDKLIWKTMSDKVATFINKIDINELKGKQIEELSLSDDGATIVFLKCVGKFNYNKGASSNSSYNKPQAQVPAQAQAPQASAAVNVDKLVPLLTRIAVALEKGSVASVASSAKVPLINTFTPDELKPDEELPPEISGSSDVVSEADLEDFPV